MGLDACLSESERQSRARQVVSGTTAASATLLPSSPHKTLLACSDAGNWTTASATHKTLAHSVLTPYTKSSSHLQQDTDGRGVRSDQALLHSSSHDGVFNLEVAGGRKAVNCVNILAGEGDSIQIHPTRLMK